MARWFIVGNKSFDLVCCSADCWTKATVEYNQLLIISRKYNQMSKDEQKANATAIDAERKALDKESSAVFGSAGIPDSAPMSLLMAWPNWPACCCWR